MAPEVDLTVGIACRRIFWPSCFMHVFYTNIVHMPIIITGMIIFFNHLMSTGADYVLFCHETSDRCRDLVKQRTRVPSTSFFFHEIISWNKQDRALAVSHTVVS